MTCGVARNKGRPRGGFAGPSGGLARRFQGFLQSPARKEHSMNFRDIAGAACRALTARKDGPSLYDICDPLLLELRWRRPAPRQILPDRARQSGVAPAAAPGRLAGIARRRPPGSLQQALTRARDDAAPDWAAIGQPVAALLDTIKLSHPEARRRCRRRRARPTWPKSKPRSAVAARICCGSFRRQRLHPDLCRLQPDRRPRFRRPRTADGADRPQCARLQELDAAVQSGAGVHRALARPQP